MKIGDFKWWTDHRELAATVATLGVPFKNPVPITNTYSSENPKPHFPVGHSGWRPGKVLWWFEAVSDTWETGNPAKPVKPKDITKAFFDGKAAAAFPDQIKALNAAFEAKDMPAAQAAWNSLRDALPYVLAGYLAIMAKNRLLIWLPMLKKAYTSIAESQGQGHIHMSTNPTEEVKKAFL